MRKEENLRCELSLGYNITDNKTPEKRHELGWDEMRWHERRGKLMSYQPTDGMWRYMSGEWDRGEVQ